MKIYTKTGDDGSTGLFDGTRVPKSNARVDAYGEVDELNSCLGAVRAFLEDTELRDLLLGIQRDLFALGARLADPAFEKRPKKGKTELGEERIVEFERLMDRFDAQLPPLRGFLLPGGTKAGALLHVARTVCRRAERKIVGLPAADAASPFVVRYVNRLSDLLFVLARAENQRGHEEQLPW
ncbi:MAG: cob(I)yrinic acid a,c-diamide adenosyltransferase [Planctomycetes bacterium]|nr:cob(I)yrinic acid a,c-diamide adenosyltransferase [Planctomycetota bacterium]